MEQIIEFYYNNEARELRKMVDKVLKKLSFVVNNKDDYYSLADEIFVDVLKRYDNNRDFDDFLYSCLSNKFKTEMTRQNRQKRKCDKNSISLDIPVGENGDILLSETLADNKTVESEVFQCEEEFSDKMLSFLECLSPLQKKIALLIADGYTDEEIIEELHITKAHLENSKKRMFQPSNTAKLK